MALNSINTNIAAYYAQSSISMASDQTSLSVARLSSGNRVIRAADDVAALSAGTSLRTNVTTLRRALINVAQGSSLLQVADAALAQVQEVLQRQKAIAVQAGSGTLTSAERSFLNQEFTALSSEIDRLVGNTNFNGVKLLNGELFDVTSVDTNNSAATAAGLSITFNQNVANVTSANIIINGTTITIGNTTTNNVIRQDNVADTISKLADYLNGATATALSQARYTASGNVLTITSRAGGVLGQNFAVETSIAKSTAFSDTGSFTIGSTQNNIVTVAGQQTGYSYQQIWGFSISDTNSAALSNNMSTGNFTVLDNDLSAVTAYTISSTSTLQDLVDGINLTSGTTGVTAKIVGASGYYGIQLETSTQRNATSMTTATAIFGGGSASAGFFISNATGSTQLRSNSYSISNLRTRQVSAAGIFGAWSEGAGTANTVIVNGTTIATVGTSIATIFDTLRTFQTATGIAATLEYDSTYTATGQYYIVLSSRNNSPITIDGDALDGSGFTSNITYTRKVEASGADNNGLRQGATIATGTMGDSILNSLANSRSSLTLDFSALQTLSNLNRKTISFDVGDGLAAQLLTFTILDTAASSATTFDDNVINYDSNTDSINDVLDRILQRINSYLDGNGEIDGYPLRQLEGRREDRKLIFEYQGLGDLTANAGSATALKMFTNIASTDATLLTASTQTLAGYDAGTFQVASFNSGSVTGIDASGVINSSFVGIVSGFSAEFGGTNNSLTLKLTVGGVVYSANNVNTNVTTSTTVRLKSDTGGYLDLFFAANQGADVTSQSAADLFASRLDKAFSTMTFYQNRLISSYSGAGDIVSNSAVSGSLTGTSFELQGQDFTDLKIQAISITAPPEGAANGVIQFTINGEVYRSKDTIGSSLAARGVYTFVSQTNPNNILKFKVGDTAISFNNDQKAANFQSALENAFGVGEGGQSLKFQVGVTTTDTLSLSISSVTTTKIYDGKSLNVLTQDAAAEAADQIDAAISQVTGVRADVGALQSRFDFAQAAAQSALQNQDQARGVLLDVDIAAESTSYATNQVKLQAGISVLAQANAQTQALLKLIG